MTAFQAASDDVGAQILEFYSKKKARSVKEEKAHQLSVELQIGKAAEHIACADLILQDFNAFTSDAGLPYDVVVDVDGHLLRIQVKGTLKKYTHPKKRRSNGTPVCSYRFRTRKGRHYARIDAKSVDMFAFVALDIRKVAYLKTEDLLTRDNQIISLVEFVDEDDGDGKRWGRRTFQKCAKFSLKSKDESKEKACFRCGVVQPVDIEHFVANKTCRSGFVGVCRSCSRPENTTAARIRRQKAQESSR